MEKVKVMIVDDQYIARQLFEMYIKSSEKYKLVMQVDSAALATKALKEKSHANGSRIPWICR